MDGLHRRAWMQESGSWIALLVIPRYSGYLMTNLSRHWWDSHTGRHEAITHLTLTLLSITCWLEFYYRVQLDTLLSLLMLVRLSRFLGWARRLFRQATLSLRLWARFNQLYQVLLSWRFWLWRLHYLGAWIADCGSVRNSFRWYDGLRSGFLSVLFIVSLDIVLYISILLE